jgi:hypothetical protein
MKLPRHAGIAALAAIVAPLAIAFCWHSVIVSLADDSVSYLTLAAWLAPWGNDLAKPWAAYVSHFPPLFPLLLVATGGSQNFLVAHLTVAACAIASVPIVHAYASRALESERAGLLATLLFVAAPGYWISMHGILSEPLFVMLTVAALAWHDRMAGDARDTRAYWILGSLVAAACLTRVAGVALVAAYAVHVAVRALSRRERPRVSELLPILVPAVLYGLWIVARPHAESNSYGAFLDAIVDRWRHDPDFWSATWETFFGGWVALFESNSGVNAATRGVFLVAWILAVAGALDGARRNRFDAWYLLASLAMIWIWNFPERMMMRLTFPVLPLMIVHGARALRVLLGIMLGPAPAQRGLLATWALVVALVAPATALVASKALERAPLVPGLAYSASSVTEYYTNINTDLARAVALTNSTTLVGLSMIARDTPESSPVMWVRPEYIATVARRPGVPFYFEWDRARLARQIRDSGARYLVFCRVYKTDLAGRKDDVYAQFIAAPPAYLRRAISLKGVLQQDDFVLFEVDRELLDKPPPG